MTRIFICEARKRRGSIASHQAGFRPISAVDTLGRRSRWSRTYENQNAFLCSGRLGRVRDPRSHRDSNEPVTEVNPLGGVPATQIEEQVPAVAATDSYVGDVAPGIQRGYGQPDLFYNFYTQGAANRANAQMYLSPMPIPPNVGHTYYTYQPFYPHHMLYPHQNRFHRHYDCGRGMNRTKASYYYPPVRQTASNLYWNFLRMPR